ncbi:hypothetical protein KI387_029453 [Taxus chinensis]|uniref:non-specific serine/threonine protein kinase n=1 Tax=Taxus chinensis TaxID=29808 RepID=A0AA38CA71_TAXCH|nr:hypothetical protein KI387_029453 [Taxus chinensis]
MPTPGAMEGSSKCLQEAGSLKMSVEVEHSQAAEADRARQPASPVEDGTSNKQLDGVDILLSNTSSLVRDLQALSSSHEIEAASSNHSREKGISKLSRSAASGKSPMKKPLRVGIQRASEAGISEKMTLKQALRGMSISQASELASLKRHSKPPGISQISEAGAIKQRYRAVVISRAIEPSTSKHITWAQGTSHELEGGILKPSLRETSASEISESCSLKLSSVIDTSLFSAVSSSEAGSSQNNDVENRQGNGDTSDTFLPASSGLHAQSSKNSTDFVRVTITSNKSNNAEINIDNGSESKSITGKTIQGSKSNDRADYIEITNSSASRVSSSSGVSDESSCSSLSSSGNRPHMSNDSRWEAIRAVRMRDGNLGLKHFRLLKKLGEGDIGSVYLSQLNGTRCYFAMKFMNYGSLVSRKKMLRAQTEREILQMLDHPFLPTLYAHFQTEKFSCLVMEYCPGGDLHILRQRQPGRNFSEQAARFYAAEVLLALEYLHMLGVVYRDLKPENVLVREDGHVMLSDFDLSMRCAVSPTLVKSSSVDLDHLKRIPAFCIQPACIPPPCVEAVCVQPSCFTPRFLSQRSKKVRKPKIEVCNQVTPLTELVAEPITARSNSFVGTHEYLAPEIVKGEGHGSAVDWWTFGIFLYELLFGKTPFKGEGNTATLNNVVGQPLKFPETPTVSYAAKDLVRGLLVKEPQHRLAFKRGATEIKQHPFFEGLNWALIRCSTPPEVPKLFETSLPVKTLSSGSTSQKKFANMDSSSRRNHLEFEVF